MNDEQKAFEKAWLHKIVAPKEEGFFSGLPFLPYVVTAALYRWETDDVTIISLAVPDNLPEGSEPVDGMPTMIKIDIAPDEVDAAMDGLHVIGDWPEGKEFSAMIQSIYDNRSKK